MGSDWTPAGGPGNMGIPRIPPPPLPLAAGGCARPRAGIHAVIPAAAIMAAIVAKSFGFIRTTPGAPRIVSSYNLFTWESGAGGRIRITGKSTHPEPGGFRARAP